MEDQRDYAEETANRTLAYPDPTTDRPTREILFTMVYDGEAEATDGCVVEPDGQCEHGHPSWLLHLNLI